MIEKGVQIRPSEGKLGVLMPGLGAVSTTFIAGVEAIKKQIAQPIGSLTQMGTIRLGKRTEHRIPKLKDFVPLAGLNDLVFGGWDIFEDNCYEAALKAGVLDRTLLERVREGVERVVPWKAVFDRNYVKNLEGVNIKAGKSKMDLAEQVMADIADFRQANDLARVVMVWCGSTEAFLEPQACHQSIETFEKALTESDDAIAPSMVYAYAALKSGVGFANGAPNLTVDIPAMLQLAQEQGVPVCGKDFKTGQTLMKTIIAPGLKSRMIGLNGWFSTNILGNRDGEVLDDPESFRTKEESKLSVLDQILQPDLYPDLYGNFTHKVRINYYPPRGDNKEGWDSIDIFGWLGAEMQIKIDFLCRDSILAAPIALDLVLRNRKRLEHRNWKDQAKPMLSARNIRYEMGDRMRGLSVGGIGMMHQVARRTGLIEAIDKDVHVLKRHLPYQESDHVLNIAYNALSGGTCMEDIELRRNDEVYLDALGAQRIPDPTTAGDFCRRFEEDDVESLMDTFNKVRLKVWAPAARCVFRGSGSGGGRDIGPNHRRMQRRDGRGLRRDMGLSPTVDFAGEHGRTVIPGEPERQPALA